MGMGRNTRTKESYRVGVIGCGAVAEMYHLPVLAARDDIALTAFVDPNRERAERLAAEYGVSEVARADDRLKSPIDIAVIAVPHRLHAAVATRLLGRGAHVLVEKPMAMSSAECAAINRAAAEADRVVAVAMQFRYGRTETLTKRLIDAGTLGAVRRFDLRWGGAYSWPVEDTAMLSVEKGGGVVPGMAVHFLDQLIWWFGDCRKVSYWDDAMGGVEAECLFELTLESGITGAVEVSRTRNLRNTWRIEGERGALEVGVGVGAEMRLYPVDRGELVLAGRAERAGDPERSVRDLVARLYDDFLGCIREGGEPRVSGRQAAPSVRVMELGARHRKLMPLPWMITDRSDPAREVTHAAFSS